MAFESSFYNEHPAEKVLRLINMWGLAVDLPIKNKLQNPSQRDSLFQQITFSYLKDKNASEIIIKVFADGSFLTTMRNIPAEWRAQKGSNVNPVNFIVYPEHIIWLTGEAQVSSLELSEKYSLLEQKQFDIEKPVEIQNDEETSQLQQEMANYLEEYQNIFAAGQNASDYQTLLNQIGYRFNANIFGATQKEKIKAILTLNPSNSLYSGYWRAEKIRQLGVPLQEQERIVSDLKTEVNNELYFTTTTAYPQSLFGNLYKVAQNGTVGKIFTAPGRIFLGHPNPKKANKLLISAEGYKDDDPRCGSLFEYDLINSSWQVIRFPGRNRGGGNCSLYVDDGYYSADLAYLYVDRYGFPDEESGIWVVNLTDYTNQKLAAWDHIVQMKFYQEKSRQSYFVAIAAKEVENNFSMTISKAKMQESGNNSKLNEVARLGIMTGWNPVISQIERNNDNLIVYTEINYDFTPYLENRAKAVFKSEIYDPLPTPIPTITPTSTPIPTNTPTPNPCVNPSLPVQSGPLSGSINGVSEPVRLTVLPSIEQCGTNKVEYYFRHSLSGGISLGDLCGWSTNPYCETTYDQVGSRFWQVKARIYDSYYQVYRESDFTGPWEIKIAPLKAICSSNNDCIVNYGCLDTGVCNQGACEVPDTTAEYYDTEGQACDTGQYSGRCILGTCFNGPPR